MKKVAAILLTLLAAGCSGSSSQGEAPKSIDQLGKAACGAEFERTAQPEMFVQAQGSCDSTFIYTFADNQARDQWVQAAKSLGSSGFMKTGDKLAVLGPDQAEVERIFKAVA